MKIWICYGHCIYEDLYCDNPIICRPFIGSFSTMIFTDEDGLTATQDPTDDDCGIIFNPTDATDLCTHLINDSNLLV